MFGFADYFPQAQRGTGYRDSEEAIADRIHFLDMVIENYLDARAGASDTGLVFSKGLKMTEDEAQDYYFTRPSERRSLGYRADFAVDAVSALSYIREREGHTAEEVRLLFARLRDTFGLTPFEELAVLCAAAVHVDLKYTRLFGYIQNEPTLQFPTLGLVVALYESYVCGESVLGQAASLASENGKMLRFFFDRRQAMVSVRPLLHLPLVLHRQLLDWLMAGGGWKAFRSESLSVSEPDDDPAPAFFDEELALIRRYEGIAVGQRSTGDGSGENPINIRRYEGVEEESLPIGGRAGEDLAHIRSYEGTEEEQCPIRDMVGEDARNQRIEEIKEEQSPYLEVACKQRSSRQGFVYIEGNDIADVRHLLLAAAGERGCPLYVLDSMSLPGGQEASREQLQAFLQGDFIRMSLEEGICCVVLSGGDDSAGSEKRIRTLLTLLAENLPLQKVYLCGRKQMPKYPLPPELSPSVITLPQPDLTQRLAIWEYYCGREGVAFADDVVIEDIADGYELSLGQIREIAVRAGRLCRMGGAGGILTREGLLSLLHRQSAANFGSLTTWIPARYTWEDIEISDSQRSMLKAACTRYLMKNRLDRQYGLASRSAYGNGVSILLYGPPGTGKTMAAQVIANETGLDLYRIDVSQIFSKYIGETQKNLSAIFAEASKTNVILFFDEADALFSKRTEIKSSNDRHANAETAFLLQRVEEYRGITILATNLFMNFDSAFVRRLTYTVRFDNPDAAVRLRLWKGILPDTVPMAADIDFDFLAENFELSGSSIRSILYSAAYMALSKQGEVAASDLVRAMYYEFGKLGQIPDPGKFGKYAPFVYDLFG